MIGGLDLTIIVLALIGYGLYDKHTETRQIEALSKIDGLSYEELSKLIDKIKR